MVMVSPHIMTATFGVRIQQSISRMNAVERSNGTNIQGWSSETGYHWQSTEGYEIYHIGYGVGDWFERKFEVKDPDHNIIGYKDRVGDAIECANIHNWIRVNKAGHFAE